MNRTGLTTAAIALASLAGVAWGQAESTSQLAPGSAARVDDARVGSPDTGIPQKDTLIRMMRKLTVEFADQPLREVMEYIEETTGANLDVKWRTDRLPDGLDPEEVVTASAQNVSALHLLERVLEAYPAEFGDTPTWQMTSSGEMQIGPRSVLNKYRRIEIYDISDMLLVIPDFTNAPELDLQAASQSGQGGGSQSPFRNETQGQDRYDDVPTKDERAQEVIDLLTDLVEPEEWDVSGGTNTIRHYRGTLIVNAADYVHRGIVGYAYWPSEHTVAGKRDGVRYVGLSMDTGISTIDDIRNQPVSAVVGGQIVESGGGGP